VPAAQKYGGQRPEMRELRLNAEDTEDLEVIAAHVQDAVMQVRDLTWLPSVRRFALVMNRFRWEEGAQAKAHSRMRAGLHFEDVLQVRVKNIAQGREEGVLNLLTLSFRTTEAPSGVVSLTFSGGGEIELEVEALAARLTDMGLSWPTQSRPAHEIGKE